MVYLLRTIIIQKALGSKKKGNIGDREKKSYSKCWEILYFDDIINQFKIIQSNKSMQGEMISGKNENVKQNLEQNTNGL